MSAPRRIAIGSDHAGYDLKAHLVASLTRQGHTVTDFGTDSAESVDYPPICAAVARAVQQLVADPAAMASMGAAARERALVEFSPTRMLAEHTAAYERAIGGRR